MYKQPCSLCSTFLPHRNGNCGVQQVPAAFNQIQVLCGVVCGVLSFKGGDNVGHLLPLGCLQQHKKYRLLGVPLVQETLIYPAGLGV